MYQCKWCYSAIKIGKGPAAVPEWKRWQCTKCGSFGYVSEPDNEALSQLYQSAWQDPNRIGSFAAGSTNELISHSLLKAIRFSPNGCNCLDYGGGKGYFTKALLECGCDNLTVYEPFGQNPGIESVNWINDSNNILEESFEWIFMIEVLEHLLNPQKDLMKIFRYLVPGGKLFITTPNAKGWRAKTDGFDWREVQNPTHINLFTGAILKKCLIEAGFSTPKRIFRPVNYKGKGLKAMALSMTQLVGIDGGLRFIATKVGR